MVVTIPFEISEMKCPCGCAKVRFDKPFRERLVAARTIAGRPFRISSWCRCEKHNRKVGGSKHSSHLTGQAVDIKISTSTERYIIVSALITAGFTRIRIYPAHIHAVYKTNAVAKTLAWGKY